jgi:hypothetical protein
MSSADRRVNGHALPAIVERLLAEDSPHLIEQLTLWGWSANRLWVLSFVLCAVVAAVDALLGHRLVLIGLLIVGPCCAVLTGRCSRTALTGAWAVGLAVVLGLPDRIWPLNWSQIRAVGPLLRAGTPSLVPAFEITANAVRGCCDTAYARATSGVPRFADTSKGCGNR